MTTRHNTQNPNKNRSPRHRAREFALQGIYQWLLNNEDSGVIDAHIRGAHGFEKADLDHFNVLLHGAINQSIQPQKISRRSLIVALPSFRQLNTRCY